MFENFRQAKVQTTDPEVSINLRYGGSGPPDTSATWKSSDLMSTGTSLPHA